MKKTSPKIITICDIIQWNNNNELTISPKYQRNSVWTEKAKSYLIDTIVRGLPIPPIFLRQMVDVSTKKTYRELIDGQQRVRAIIEFVENKFRLHKNHNNQLGGKYYEEMEEDIKEDILQYELTSEVVSEENDAVIYDIFARLNGNNIVLNKQEIRNAKFSGDFKVIVYKLSSKYREFFLKNKILNDKECSRMKDSELINSLLILIINGVTTETQNYVNKIYQDFDNDKENLLNEVEEKINYVMDVVSYLYGYFNDLVPKLFNKNYFYTFFCFFYHQIFGIKDSNLKKEYIFSKIDLIKDNIFLISEKFSNLFRDIDDNNKKYLVNDSDHITREEFVKYHSIRTTNKKERSERIALMTKYMVNPND